MLPGKSKVKPSKLKKLKILKPSLLNSKPKKAELGMKVKAE